MCVDGDVQRVIRPKLQLVVMSMLAPAVAQALTWVPAVSVLLVVLSRRVRRGLVRNRFRLKSSVHYLYHLFSSSDIVPLGDLV